MKTVNRIDQTELQKVLSIQTNSDDDSAMSRFLLERLSHMKVTVQLDKYGNIYVTKGKSTLYPCLIAHTDTVQDLYKNITIYRNNDTLFSFDTDSRTQIGIGGDDKVGIYILLQAIQDMSVIKAVFFRHEEIGRLGSRYAIENHKKWFKDCAYIINPDRNGTSDLITSIHGSKICSEEFLKACEKYSLKYNYKEKGGAVADVYTLSKKDIGISCINISCGYFNPHSSLEIVSIEGVNKAYNFIYDVINRVELKRYKFTFKEYSYTETYKYRSGIYKGQTSPIGRQQSMFNKNDAEYLSAYANTQKFNLFKLVEVLKNKVKIYDYIGVDSIPVATSKELGECGCKPTTNLSTEIAHFLPYSGEFICASDTQYQFTDKEIKKLLKLLEVDDSDETFVFSIYSRGWLLKRNSLWNSVLEDWVPDSLPF